MFKRNKLKIYKLAHQLELVIIRRYYQTGNRTMEVVFYMYQHKFSIFEFQFHGKSQNCCIIEINFVALPFGMEINIISKTIL